MPVSSSDHATAGAPLFPWRAPPAVASLLLLLLVMDASERIDVLEVLFHGV